MNPLSALQQPDFVITVNGTDVTKFCQEWEVNDVEEAVSNMRVTLVNRHMELSGQFNVGQSLTIKFGYQGEVDASVTMLIKEYSENYTVRGMFIVLVAMDCSQKLTASSFRGNFKEGLDAKGAIKDIGDGQKINIDTGDFIPPKMAEDFALPMHNYTNMQALRHLMDMCFVKKKGGKGSTGKGGGASKRLPVKDTPAPKNSEFRGLKAAGGLVGRMSLDETEQKGKEVPIRSWILNKNRRASTTSIRGFLEIIGRTMLKGKTMVTVLNVGPQASGEWYAKSVTHSWHVGHGYMTRAELVRDYLGKDGEKLTQPMVHYADIWKKDTMYVGPRKLDQKGGTYTYGKDDRLVVTFKLTIVQQQVAASGERNQVERMFPDNSKKSNDGTGNPINTDEEK